VSALLEIILPVFLVIGAGYLAVKFKLFPETGVDGLMKFTQQFAIPCLLFKAIAELELGVYFTPSLLASYYVPAVLMFALGSLGARLLFGRPWEDSIAIGFACGEAPMATVRAVIRAIFHNALILGLALGFAVNLSGVAIPTVASDALDLMIRAALPAAIFGLGGVLAQYKFEGDLGPVLMICALCLLVRPALSYGMAGPMELDTGALRSSVLTAAMAPGVNAYIFANMYGVAKRVTASAVLAATALSVLSVTGWLLILP